MGMDLDESEMSLDVSSSSSNGGGGGGVTIPVSLFPSRHASPVSSGGGRGGGEEAAASAASAAATAAATSAAAAAVAVANVRGIIDVRHGCENRLTVVLSNNIFLRVSLGMLGTYNNGDGVHLRKYKFFLSFFSFIFHFSHNHVIYSRLTIVLNYCFFLYIYVKISLKNFIEEEYKYLFTSDYPSLHGY